MVSAIVILFSTVVSLPFTTTILFSKEEPRRRQDTKMLEGFVTLYAFVSLWFKKPLIVSTAQVSDTRNDATKN